MAHRAKVVALILVQSEIEFSAMLNDCRIERTQQYMIVAIKFWNRDNQQTVLWEHELDHVFVGNYEADFHLNPEEVAEVRYISMQDLDEEMRTHPEHFTEWFKIILEEYQHHF